MLVLKYSTAASLRPAATRSLSSVVNVLGPAGAVRRPATCWRWRSGWGAVSLPWRCLADGLRSTARSRRPAHQRVALKVRWPIACGQFSR